MLGHTIKFYWRQVEKMAINLVVEPNVSKTWEQFVNENPAYSIGIDGYVHGPTRFDNSGIKLNLNHHDGVDRLSTRSSSGQMMIYIKQGLFKKFVKDGRPTADIFVNDPDEDVCLSYWLAKNNERISGMRSEPLISKLVFAEDVLDATAGAYPFSLDSDLMREITWIFEPYASQKKEVRSMSDSGMKSIIESVGQRIDKYLIGKGEQRKPDGRFDLICSRPNWVMMQEIGPYAKSILFNMGMFSFVSYKGENPNGVHRYSIGRMSPFIDFPVVELFEHLNSFEGIPSDCNDRWGGGNVIGGSPREKGSSIAPHKLIDIIDDFLGRKR